MALLRPVNGTRYNNILRARVTLPVWGLFIMEVVIVSGIRDYAFWPYRPSLDSMFNILAILYI